MFKVLFSILMHRFQVEFRKNDLIANFFKEQPQNNLTTSINCLLLLFSSYQIMLNPVATIEVWSAVKIVNLYIWW
jgi:hypothetical protein